MNVETRNGLHYVEGLPSAFEYAYRGLTFVLAVIVAGMLLGLLRQRRDVHRGLWWVALGCFLFVARSAVVQAERWVTDITVESLVGLPAILCICYGMLLRMRDGTIGR